MSTTKGYYSIIQYCPDLSRLEAANIGVLLFCPKLHFLKALTDEGEDRVRQFFGARERQRGQVSAFRKAIEERLKTDGEHFQVLEDLQDFIAKRANAIQLTAPRPVKVFDPESDLKELFEQLVQSIPKQEIVSSVPEVITESVSKVLRKVFTDKSVEPFIHKNIPVKVPAFCRVLRVPFGFQNGSFNLIKPVRFDNKSETEVDKETSFHALAGKSLAEHGDPNLGALQLTVVGQFSPEQESLKEVIGNLLLEHSVKLFPLENLGKLVDEIRTTGKLKHIGAVDRNFLE